MNDKHGILAIQLKIGKENPFFTTLNIKKWDFTKSLATEGEMICLKGINDPDSTKFEMSSVLNGAKSTTFSFYKYTGSLTKPPCKEKVEWFVMKYPSEISEGQLSDLKTFGI